jgi:hypothetical protein
MRRAAWSPPSATIAGTTIEAATAAEILGVFVGSWALYTSIQARACLGCAHAIENQAVARHYFPSNARAPPLLDAHMGGFFMPQAPS